MCQSCNPCICELRTTIQDQASLGGAEAISVLVRLMDWYGLMDYFPRPTCSFCDEDLAFQELRIFLGLPNTSLFLLSFSELRTSHENINSKPFTKRPSYEGFSAAARRRHPMHWRQHRLHKQGTNENEGPCGSWYNTMKKQHLIKTFDSKKPLIVSDPKNVTLFWTVQTYQGLHFSQVCQDLYEVVGWHPHVIQCSSFQFSTKQWLWSKSKHVWPTNTGPFFLLLMVW